MKPLLLFLILLASEKECNQKNELPFLMATSQNWSGGAAGYHGTYYKIYFIMKESADYQFDSLWTDEKRIPAVMMKNKTASDTLMIMANDQQGIYDPVNQREVTNSVPSKFPIDTKAQGVLGYFYKGERKYFQVQEWKTLKALAYP